MSSRPSWRPADPGGRTLRVEPGGLDRRAARAAAAILQGGGIVAMRTDTVYGLLASVSRPEALRRLAELKVRPPGKPFVLLAADWIGVRSVTAWLPPVARALGARYWPGPLTLILPGEESLPDEVKAAGPTVAVRIPGDDLVREIVAEARSVLAAPSANRPGEEPLRSVERIPEIFGDRIDLVLDGGIVAEGAQPSTIVNCAGKCAEVIRQGPIALSARELAVR